MTSTDAAVSDDRGRVYVNEAGRPIYRASGLYACTSILIAGRLGLTPGDPPAWMQTRFDEGHTLEPVLMERARLRGMTVANMQGTVRQDVGPATIVGHIDGLGYPEGDGFLADTLDFASPSPSPFAVTGHPVILIDAKALAQSTWDEWCRGIANGDVWDRFPYYAWQQSIYAKAHGGIPIAMAVGLKDRSDEDNVHIVDFRLDVFTHLPVPFGKIMARVLEVERRAAEGMEGLPHQCDMRTFPCPYWSYPFHTDADGKKADGTLEFGEDDVEGGLGALAKLADRRLQVQNRLKEAQAELEEVDRQIVAATGDRVGNAKVAAHSSQVSSVSLYHHGYSTVDWGGMARDFPGLEKAKYQKLQQSSKVTVKLNPKRGTAKVNVEGIVE